jgi:hypothetical protein
MLSSIVKSVGVGSKVQASELDIDGDITVGGHLTMSDAKNIVVNTSTGTKIGTATGQKIGFFNATPVNQPDAVTDGSDAATTQAAVNAVIDRLQELGLLA